MGIREGDRFESIVVCKQKISFVLRLRLFSGEGEKEKQMCKSKSEKNPIYISVNPISEYCSFSHNNFDLMIDATVKLFVWSLRCNCQNVSKI